MTKYLLTLAFLITGCSFSSKSIITYKYKNIIVTRVTTCSKSTFYYGTEYDRTQGKIWVGDSGLVSGYSGYIEFSSNGRVRILSGDGYFQTSNNDSSKFFYERIYAYSRPEICDSIYYFNSAINIEIEKNNEGKTMINVNYDSYNDKYCF